MIAESETHDSTAYLPPLPANSSTVPASDARPEPAPARSFLSLLVARPTRAVLKRLRLLAWSVLDLHTEFSPVD